MTAIVAFVLKRPWVLALAALLLLSGGLFLKFKVVKGKLVQAQSQVELLTQKIGEQNRAVEAWKRAADIQAARATEAEEKAARARKASAGRVQRILSEPVPAACPEAIQWAASIGIELVKRWEEESP
ncbi:MAG TPA: hypothetical protein PK416_08865 [Thermodesulfobacteriota bacterium]|nr:hypothetical protein [Thermodesulfobacteriota bacterium]